MKKVKAMILERLQMVCAAILTRTPYRSWKSRLLDKLEMESREESGASR